MTRLVVAFASAAHSRQARSMLAAAAFPVSVSEPSGGEGGDLATVRIEVSPQDAQRARTLIAGVWGLIVEDVSEAAASA